MTSFNPSTTSAASEVARPWFVPALLSLFVALWTLYGAITGQSSAVHHDTVEAYVWGREFQLGYYKHPPLWAWMAGAWFLVAPHQDWAFRLLSMINAAIGLWGSWRLIGDFTEGASRPAATLLLLLTPCFTFLAYKFNANSIFLSVWPWALHYFVRSFDTRGWRDAVMFGAFMAAAVLSKYFAVILAVTCLLAMFMHPLWRRYLRSSAPYVSIAVAVALLVPHLWWLVQTGFLPFHYFDQETGRSYAPVLLHALGTVGAVVALHVFVIALVASCGSLPFAQWPDSAVMFWLVPRNRMLAVLALAPVVLSVAVALVFRNKISSSMFIGTFSLIPLLLIKIAKPNSLRLLHRASIGAGLIAIASLALSPAIALAKMRFSREPDIMQPRAEVAQVVTRIWRRSTRSPLMYVAGSEFYANATGFYGADHPHVFIDFNYREAPWVTPDRLRRGGLVVVCDDDDEVCLANANRIATPRTFEVQFAVAHTYGGLAKPIAHFKLFVTPPTEASGPASA